MPDKQRVLIIKPGYSETLDPDTSGIVSLGDVLRSTVILHLFPRKSHHITWVVDPASYPLLRGNKLIDQIWKINPFTPFHLMQQHFDTVVNLEKDPGICALADRIPAWRRYGFRFDTRTGGVSTYDLGQEALAISQDPSEKRRHDKSWSQVLFEMCGHQYKGERPVLGYQPDVEPRFDFGFNFRVGRKWPNKAWPLDYWRQLEKMLAAAHSVTWQPETDDVENIERYIDWVASARVLITNDSLGLHIAQALGRPLVALFGPTKDSEIDPSPGCVKLASPLDWDCIPCLSPSCHRSRPCIAAITPQMALDAATIALNVSGRRRRPRRPPGVLSADLRDTAGRA